MTARILSGEVVADAAKVRYRARVEALRERGVSVGLGTILVGDDGPSANYVAMKHRDCEEVGIRSVHRHLPANVTLEDVLRVVDEFNADPEVDAYLVQLPLPNGIDEERVLTAVDPSKDVDGLHPLNLGKLVMGKDGPLPCTPAGIIELLDAYEIPVEGRHVVIVGRGLTVGRPLALMLSSNRPGCNAAVTVVHSRVPDLGRIVSLGDIVVSAAGSPALITGSMIRPGAVVIGAGTSWEGRRLVSDLAEDVAEIAGAITPRLGGVGPMTRSMLLHNVLSAAERAAS
ncbi:MAG: bifunctional 5,10-methylenetetrahydrofolate dehydrogenase/5,10-methenyltetrahydrofolate cyclohydrolase [Acidimicrobiales bacterium]